MRKMKTILTLTAAFLVYGAAMATGNLKVNLKPVNNDLTEVEISNANLSNFEIEVVNEKGEMVFYKETLSPSTMYKRNYDFSLLENGTYFFKVNIEKETMETKFSIDKGKLKILDERKIVQPYFVFDGNHFKLTYLNFEGENTSLTIYDNSRNQLYWKKLNSDFVIQHGLNFSKARKGSYLAVLSSGNEVHSYDIIIN